MDLQPVIVELRATLEQIETEILSLERRLDSAHCRGQQTRPQLLSVGKAKDPHRARPEIALAGPQEARSAVQSHSGLENPARRRSTRRSALMSTRSQRAV